MRCKVLKSFANFEKGSPKIYSEGEVVEIKEGAKDLIRAGLVEPVKEEAKKKSSE